MSENVNGILYTGHDLLPKGDSKSHQFGSLSAWSPVKGKGTVRLMFNKADVKLIHSEVDHVIELPEEYALHLAEILSKSLIRLDHLRKLSRLGRLDASAYYRPGESPDAPQSP